MELLAPVLLGLGGVLFLASHVGEMYHSKQYRQLTTRIQRAHDTDNSTTAVNAINDFYGNRRIEVATYLMAWGYIGGVVLLMLGLYLLFV